MKRMTRVALITSGGDCQGLNAAMRGVAKALYEHIDNIEIFGLKEYEVMALKTNYRPFEYYQRDPELR